MQSNSTKLLAEVVAAKAIDITSPITFLTLLSMDNIYNINYLFNSDAIANVALYIVDKVRFLFYLVSPSETMYSSVDKVPRYIAEVSRQEISNVKLQQQNL